MSLTREDMLRELELLPVWSLHSPQEASLEANQYDEKTGQPFIDDAGALLDKMLIAIQLQRSKNVYLTYLSLPYFNRQITLIQPKLIVLFGEQVAQCLLESNDSLDALRGKVHKYKEVSVIVSYSPAHLLAHTQDKVKAWADLCLARTTMQGLK